MTKFLKLLFFALFVKPLVYVVLGLNVRNAQKLPKEGPAIIVANHSSHIDTLILMSLFPLKRILSIRPIAAKDYFLKTKLKSWFSLNIIGIIPVERNTEKFSHIHPFEAVTQSLSNNEIVIIYPEGTRGSSEEIGEFKRGVAHLAKLNPQVPIIPVYIHNPDMVLPKGDGILVPFICDVFIGDKMNFSESTEKFTLKLKEKVEELKTQCFTRQ